MHQLPNIITSIRILLIPLIPFFYLGDYTAGKTIAVAILIFAGFSDFLDGYLARKYKLVSKFGMMFDPFADKLLLVVTLLTLYFAEKIPLVIPVVFILKELMMITLGSIIYIRKRDSVIAANKYGKLGTLTFFLSVLFTMIFDMPLLAIALFILCFAFKFVAFISYYKGYKDNK